MLSNRRPQISGALPTIAERRESVTSDARPGSQNGSSGGIKQAPPNLQLAGRKQSVKKQPDPIKEEEDEFDLL